SLSGVRPPTDEAVFASFAIVGGNVYNPGILVEKDLRSSSRKFLQWKRASMRFPHLRRRWHERGDGEEVLSADPDRDGRRLDGRLRHLHVAAAVRRSDWSGR